VELLLLSMDVRREGKKKWKNGSYKYHFHYMAEFNNLRISQKN
jgi:hypothetical protein